MKDGKSRKELIAQYKGREIIGGVCAIRNLQNNKLLIEAATDLQGSRNRFEFSQKTGGCVSMKLQKDWNEQGAEQFAFEVLEELKKGDTQTAEEFKSDIDFLKDIWLEKLSDRELY